MISRKLKLKYLKTFYDNVSMKDADSQCPFGKNYHTVGDPVIQNMDCFDLCGTWLALGDVRRGCPCVTLGKDMAMFQLASILKKEGVL